jgi:predicted DNA-binding transcriptional regulator YafY
MTDNMDIVTTPVSVRLCLRVDEDVLTVIDKELKCEYIKIVLQNSENFLWVTAEWKPELLDWIRAMGPRVEVVFPLSLREHIRSSLSQALRQYRLA